MVQLLYETFHKNTFMKYDFKMFSQFPVDNEDNIIHVVAQCTCYLTHLILFLLWLF